MVFYVYIRKEYAGNWLSGIEEVNDPTEWDCDGGVLYFLLENGERIVYNKDTWTHFVAQPED